MKGLRQKNFVVFVLFRMFAKLFYMKVQDGAVLVWRKYEIFCESFFRESLDVQLAVKLFCLETFVLCGSSYKSYINTYVVTLLF